MPSSAIGLSLAPIDLVDFEMGLAERWERGSVRKTNRGELQLLEPLDTDTSPLVIKQCPGWSEEQLRVLVTATEQCRRYAETSGHRSFVAALVGWGLEPEFICSEWVSGTSVDEWLRVELCGLSSSEATGRTSPLATDIGSLVAHFHTATSPSSSNRVNANSRSDRLVRVLAGSRAVRTCQRVRTIEDPGPHNTIRDEDGGLWLIDLPATAAATYRERDLARLASRIVGSIHRHSEASWVPYGPVVEAVVDGYERVMPDGADIDRSVIHACLASDALVKALLTRRRLPRGTRLECVTRESAAALRLGATAVRLRFTRR